MIDFPAVLLTVDDIPGGICVTEFSWWAAVINCCDVCDFNLKTYLLF